MEKIKLERCTTCMYFYEHRGTDGNGECRNSPKVIAKHEMNWCGYYQEGFELTKGRIG